MPSKNRLVTVRKETNTLPFENLEFMDFGILDTNHMGWLWIKLQHFSQLHYDLELVLLKIINNE